MSAVLQYSTLDNPISKTLTCSVYKAEISRGGTSVANFNTSNLIKHLNVHRMKRAQQTVPPKL